MNGTPIIELERVTKNYRLYKRSSDRLKDLLNPFKTYYSEFSALKDLNLTIRSGETVGVVGKNGSGKSTLLKIISGVTFPTLGTAKVRGKTAALLELGAGFNPELTGMENVFLNGLLMGQETSEIKMKVPSILDFAGIGDFIDQPVRMYSSGMYARLAFAIAINVDPNILIVDETLSVGDVRFQQKCIRKLQEFTTSDKTVIFVGHDLGAINSFCTRCIWLNEGQIMADGPTQEIIKKYVSFMAYGQLTKAPSSEGKKSLADWVDSKAFESFGDGEATISSLRILTELGHAPSSLQGGENLLIELKVESTKRIEFPIFGFTVKNRLGQHVFGGNTFGHDISLKPIAIGRSLFQIAFRLPHLSNGEYTLSCALADGDQHNHVQKHWVHDWATLYINNPKIRYQNGDGLVLENNFRFNQLE